jgi:hypothetical protein
MHTKYKVLDGKLYGKRPFGRHMHRQEDNIKMYLEEPGCDDAD